MVLKNLPRLLPSTPPPPGPNVYILPTMDLVALNSSPLSGTQLQDSNRVFNKSISIILSTPTRSYAKRMTILVEKQATKVILGSRIGMWAIWAYGPQALFFAKFSKLVCYVKCFRGNIAKNKACGPHAHT